MNRKERRLQKKKQGGGNPQTLPLLQQGQTLFNAGNVNESAGYFTQALKIEPTNIIALEYLARISQHNNNFDLALQFLRQIEQQDKNNANAIGLIGRVLAQMDHYEEAIPYLERSSKLSPHDSTHRALGFLYTYRGQLNQAKTHFAKAYQMNPDHILNISGYVQHTHKVKSEDDPVFQTLLASELQVQDLPPNEQVLYYTALYKTHEDLGQPEKAIEFAVKTGDAQKQHFEKTGVKHADFIARMNKRLEDCHTFFTKDSLETLSQEDSCENPMPIFILGMPRSGTTLLEQILHAHPQIAGIGEDSTLNILITHHSDLPEQNNTPYPLRMTTEKETMSLKAIGKRYCDTVQALHPKAKRIVNKAISNFINAPYIHLSLTQAKMIHIKRNAIDTCVSCFTRAFEDLSQPQTYDMEILGDYYQRYVALMAHWNDIMPGKILNINYEDIVEDTEGSARKIIEFLELEWDDACLEFYKNQSTVKTASVTQVRQKIYTSSVARWKKYGESIRPLIDALGDCA